MGRRVTAPVDISRSLASLVSPAFSSIAFAGGLAAPVVERTSELDRILRLPRRTWDERDPAMIRLAFEMSAWLRRPTSYASLRVIQAIALAEFYFLGGLFGPMRVGAGKTLVTFLVATVMGAKRPILVIPAKLRSKTKRDFEKLAADWRGPDSLRIVSYEELSRDYGVVLLYDARTNAPLGGKLSDELRDAWEQKHSKLQHVPIPSVIDSTGVWRSVEKPTAVEEYRRADGWTFSAGTWTPPSTELAGASSIVPLRIQILSLLDFADPDLVIGDEIHRFKNIRAACTKKMDRFMDHHPMVPQVGLSGTVTKERIQDYAHILAWTHKRRAPVPLTYELKKWGCALNVRLSPSEERAEVGALLEFCSEEERKTLDPLTAARRGYRRRLIETPGVVAYSREYEGASLFVGEIEQARYSKATEDAFQNLRENSTLPNGEKTWGGLGDWAVGRQMARGFYYFPDPAPPTPWADARADWNAAVRKCIRYGGVRGIDSPFQVENAIRRHPEWADPSDPENIWTIAQAAYARWAGIRGEFIPKTSAAWIDDAFLNLCGKWMKEHKGIVWVEHVEFAQRLSLETGAPFYWRDGLDAKGRFIDDAKASEGSIIASIESNLEGRNLQFEWFDNLLTILPKGGHKLEQLLGRTHRDGQLSDEVNAYIAIACREDVEAWQSILDESAYIVDSSGLPAKIAYCDKEVMVEDLKTRAVASWRYR
jgi:hypothetical protein